MTNSSYSVAFFDEEMLGRIDTKYLSYKKELSNLYDENIDYDTLGKYIMEVKNPVKFKDGVIYKFYDTSIKSVNEKGQFVNYQLITKQTAPSRAKQVAIKDTIIVANLKTNKGKACIVTEKEDGSIVSSGYLMIKPTNKINIKYLQQILQCEFSLYYLRQIASTGLGMANWNYSDLCKIKLKVPSLEEQERTLPLVKAKIKILEDKIKELEEAKEDNSLQKVSTTVISQNYDNSYEMTQEETKFLFSNFEDMSNYLSFNNISHKEISTIEKVPLSCILEKGSDTKVKTNPNSQYIVGLEDIESFTGKIIPNKALDNGTINSDKVIFKGNDIMFAKMRPYLGKFIIVNKQNQDYIGSSELFGLKIKDGVDIRLVKILLSSNYVIDQYKQYYSGNGKPRISRDNLLKVLVPKSVIDDSENFVEEVAMRLDVNMFFDEEITQLQSIIDNDLNKYILNGYSDDLFEIPKGGR